MGMSSGRPHINLPQNKEVSDTIQFALKGKRMSASLLDHFASLDDPRIERHKRHELLDILVLVISAVCSNAKG